MDEYQYEDRDQRYFDLQGFFHGMVQEKGVVKGFGVCNHCQFADIDGEYEQHPEGLGRITTGANVKCSQNHPLPKGLRLVGMGLVSDEICPFYIPNVCDLCNLIVEYSAKNCEFCCFKEE